MKKIMSFLLAAGLMALSLTAFAINKSVMSNPIGFGTPVEFENYSVDQTFATNWCRFNDNALVLNMSAPAEAKIVDTGVSKYGKALQITTKGEAASDLASKIPNYTSANPATATAGEYVISGSYKFGDVTNERKITVKVVGEQGNKWINLILKDGQLKLDAGNGQKLATEDISADVWYDIDFCVNTVDGYAAVYINGKFVAEEESPCVGYTFYDAGFMHSRADASVSVIDNISFAYKTKIESPSLELNEYNLTIKEVMTDLNFDDYDAQTGSNGINYSGSMSSAAWSVEEDAEKESVLKSATTAFTSISFPNRDVKLDGVYILAYDAKFENFGTERKIFTIKAGNSWTNAGARIDWAGVLSSTGGAKETVQLSVNKWYSFKYILNTYTGVEKMYMDGNLIWTHQSDDYKAVFNYAQSTASVNLTTYYDNFYAALGEEEAPSSVHAVGDKVTYTYKTNVTSAASIHLYNNETDCGAFNGELLAEAVLKAGKNVITARAFDKYGSLLLTSEPIVINIGYTLDDIDLSAANGSVTASGMLDEACLVIAALYNENGTLAKASIGLFNDGPYSVTVSDIPSDLTGYSMKVMYWNSEDCITPLFDCEIIR
ncbi:MAG: hypothetical protein J6N52_11715 [Clostridia bacterium]|nr:hypothetical protein [Clostridia bacterium]